MLSPLFNHLLIPFLVAMFLAINMGGSGTGPAFSVAYGSGVIRKSLIAGLFGIMVFIGAIIAGKQTGETMGKGLLPAEGFTYVVVSIILFSVAVSLLVANLFGIPQSTSQSTVLAVSAVASYFANLNTHKLFVEILPYWLILPIIGFILSFLVGKYIYKPLQKRGFTISKKFHDHPILKAFIVLGAMYVSFSIGANNVANAAGPIASMTINELHIPSEGNFVIILIMSTLIIAPSFGIGSSLLGYRVVKKTGKEIVLFGRLEAVIISFISASLLLFASITKGIPSSLVQLNVAAILGIGVAKPGFKNIFRKTEINHFFIMWLIAPIIAFGLSLLFVYLADIFGFLKV